MMQPIDKETNFAYISSIFSSVNPFKPSGVKQLHFRVFRAILQAQWCQTVTLQSVQGHTGLTHHFLNFLTLGHSGKVPECQKIERVG